MKTFKTFNKEQENVKDFEEDLTATSEKETDKSLEKETQEEKNENV
tara:strand:- start:136 stop:273 length:138 start_codon:yes stop_codon:yes gene_type:complete